MSKPIACTKPGCTSTKFESKMYDWVCEECRRAISKDIDDSKFYVQMEEPKFATTRQKQLYDFATQVENRIKGEK
jgi:hypothetical protein